MWATKKQNSGFLFYTQSWTQTFIHLFYCLFRTLLPSLYSVHQLQLAGGERQDPTDVVGNAQGEEGDDHQQQQDPPKAQVLHKLLPGGPEAGQDALSALQVRVQ